MAGSQARGNAVIEIRKLTELDEFRAAVQLQKVIWGFDDIDLLPLRFRPGMRVVGRHAQEVYDCSNLQQNCWKPLLFL